MLKVKNAFKVAKYTVLVLDGELPRTPYSKYVIGCKFYQIVPVYDLPNCIAIYTQEPPEKFINLMVAFY